MKTIKPPKPASKLAGAKKGLGPGSVPAAGAKKSNSSFLDEWLAKKKAQSSSAAIPTSPTAPGAPSQSTVLNPQQINGAQVGQDPIQQQPTMASASQSIQAPVQAAVEPLQQNAQVPTLVQQKEVGIPLSQTSGSQQGNTLRIER